MLMMTSLIFGSRQTTQSVDRDRVVPRRKSLWLPQKTSEHVTRTKNRLGQADRARHDAPASREDHTSRLGRQKREFDRCQNDTSWQLWQILLGKNLVAKVSDFGLSCVSNQKNYAQNELLPLKWMAPEGKISSLSISRVINDVLSVHFLLRLCRKIKRKYKNKIFINVLFVFLVATK